MGRILDDNEDVIHCEARRESIVHAQVLRDAGYEVVPTRLIAKGMEITEAGVGQREMSLTEIVSALPPGHRARDDLAALKWLAYKHDRLSPLGDILHDLMMRLNADNAVRVDLTHLLERIRLLLSPSQFETVAEFNIASPTPPKEA